MLAKRRRVSQQRAELNDTQVYSVREKPMCYLINQRHLSPIHIAICQQHNS